MKCFTCDEQMVYIGKSDDGRNWVWWCEHCDTEQEHAPLMTFAQWFRFLDKNKINLKADKDFRDLL